MLTTNFDSTGQTLTLKLNADLLSSNAEQAARLFEVALGNPDYKTLIVDLLSCKMIDSVGLNLLFSLLNRCQLSGIESRVLVPKGPLSRIVQVAQLGKLFKVEIR